MEKSNEIFNHFGITAKYMCYVAISVNQNPKKTLFDMIDSYGIMDDSTIKILETELNTELELIRNQKCQILMMTSISNGTDLKLLQTTPIYKNLDVYVAIQIFQNLVCTSNKNKYIGYAIEEINSNGENGNIIFPFSKGTSINEF